MQHMKKRIIFLALTIVFLEWMDFSLYLYLAKSVFSVEFFAKSSRGMLFSFAIFATAFLARPLGGWFFGRKADLDGRRKPMVYSAALMGISTLGICFLPGYDQIGSAAAWGLLFFRMGQGLALGGEMNTSALFLVEHHPNNRLVIAALMAASGAIGMFAGAALAAFMQNLNISGLWRVAFAILGIISLWICSLRKKLDESPEFMQASSQTTHWHRHWKGIFNIALVALYVSVSVYLCNVFWVSFALDKQLLPNNVAAWLGALAQLLSGLAAIIIAIKVKDNEVQRLLQGSMLLMSVVAPLLFYGTIIHHLTLTFAALFGYVLANGMLCSSLFYFLYLQLPVELRCAGVSLVWGFAASIGAFSLPLAQHAIVQGLNWLPPLMVSVIALTSWIILRQTQTQHSFSTRYSSAS